MSMLQFFLMFKVQWQMSIHPAMRPVRRMVQCEGIVSLAMPCLLNDKALCVRQKLSTQTKK